MTESRRAVPAWLGGMLCLFVGCSAGETRQPTQPASGTVRFLGKAVPGATLVFHPNAPWGKDEPRPRATVKPDGRFEVTTYEGADGAPVGSYSVTVEWYVPNKPDDGQVTNRIPARYGKATSTPLKATITPGANQLAAFELQK